MNGHIAEPLKIRIGLVDNYFPLPWWEGIKGRGK
jgi:hypothetical protein